MNGSTRFPLSLLTLQRNYSQANGLGITCVLRMYMSRTHNNNDNMLHSTAGQEDPFELDSNLILSASE